MAVIPWTFKTWLAKFEGVDLPIGDLARDVAKDSNFPGEDAFEFILEYLTYKRADTRVIETFCIVWNFYLVSR